MDLETIAFAADTGWSRPLPTHLDSAGTLVLVFGSPALDRVAEPLAELSAAFPRGCLMGCSTAGEILDTSLLDGGLVVAVARFAHTPLKAAHAPVTDASSSYDAGARLAHELLTPALRGVLVLSEGLTVNGSELIRGLNHVLPASVVVTGGLAGDGNRFERTWVLAGKEARTRHASAVGFYGDAVSLGHGSKGGWDAFGVERRVTRAAGNVLYELNNQPALGLYKEYLGERASGLPANTRQIGFYSYGEVSPLVSGRCDLHNQTMTLTTISEAA